MSLDGTARQISQCGPSISAPFAPVKPTAVAPRPGGVQGQSTLAERPLVLMPTTVAPAGQGFHLPREDEVAIGVVPMQVRIDVSVVRATAGRAGRSKRKRFTNSPATCGRRPRMPPLPNRRPCPGTKTLDERLDEPGDRRPTPGRRRFDRFDVGLQFRFAEVMGNPSKVGWAERCVGTTHGPHQVRAVNSVGPGPAGGSAIVAFCSAAES